jgi:hypothetical protein
MRKEMKRIYEFLIRLSVLIVFVGVALHIYGCQSEPTSSLYQYNQQYLPNPIVDSLSPSSALAGIDTITIYGKNFSAVADPNHEIVYFNSSPAQIFSGDANTIKVKAPALQGDSIAVRVTVNGALLYSPTFNYKLIAAIAPYGNLVTATDTTIAVSLCVGPLPDNALYLEITSTADIDRGIVKVTASGTTTYGTATTGVKHWNSIVFGQGGYLYCARDFRAIYRYAAGGGSLLQTPWTASSSTTTHYTYMDFDPNQNLWVGGNNQSIYRIMPNASSKAYPFVGNVRSVRYFNGYLYFAANVGTAPTQVFRAPIVNDTLGSPEVYFDLSSEPSGGNNIYAITFSADGDMYAGTDSSDYLIVVHPNGIVDKPYSLFVTSKILKSPCRSFAWIGENLYTTTIDGELLQIVVRKQGAPYYGIQ